jgi:hypothetical protein
LDAGDATGDVREPIDDGRHIKANERERIMGLLVDEIIALLALGDTRHPKE